MAPVKAEELVAFAPREQYDGVDFCITSPPPWLTTVLLAFQHYLVMLGTTVIVATILVPLMGGGHVEKAIVVQTILFLAGINTLLQVHFGTRLPAVMGASYAYIYPAVAIILSPRFAIIIDPFERFVYTMRSLQGALIIAGVFQAVIGFFGIWRIFIRFLSPLAAVPFVTLSALGLFYFAFPGVAKCIEVGLPALILLLLFTEYAAHFFARGSFLFGRCAVLVTVLVVWIYAEILTAAGAYRERSIVTQFSCRADRSGLIGGAPWVRFPYPFQWGYPIFFVDDCFVMIAASFVSLIESTGTLIAVTRYAGATFCPPSVFARGVGWQGISTILNGMCGALTGTVASVENSGLLALTRVGSRRVIKISALFMIFFSLFGKFGAIIASIPLPIFSALYCVLFAYSAAAGLCFLQYCNLNTLRTKFILSISLFLGLSIPQYFREYEVFYVFGPVHTHSPAFNVIVNVIFSSPATVAAILAYLLDCTHTYWDGLVWKDRGFHWWEKFKSYRHDPRSEEFYSLPYGLSKYFPSF
ncbi:nucleobase-ascorbate transporter LPE1-like [Oryza brachyantha]|uniref:nucleobase-ascorbate transporter LPE1-like n=1 Tax=Oryza brachyantha TaxID=4533 RepID=UPI001ADAF8AF|nr:nucleobase-ascorbate transporter LPE1-like [Oryza brachyantha]